jgi:hypothetical protein
MQREKITTYLNNITCAMLKTKGRRLQSEKTILVLYRVTGNFCGNLISAVFCGQLRTAEIKIAEYYVK